MNQRHLKRLNVLFKDQPVYFITTCVHHRKPILNRDSVHEIAIDVWKRAEQLYDWFVGRYVVMPDHVHFFCTSRRHDRPLEFFVGKWKEWTAKYAHRRVGLEMPLWQEEFFDHALRSSESYEEKSVYVFNNPVRAGLVSDARMWPYQGEMNVFHGEDVDP